MQLTLRQSRKLKDTGYLLLGGSLLGPMYAVFSDGFTSFFPFINAFASGVLIALAIAFYEFVVFSGNIRKLKFYKLLILRISLYALTISFILFTVLIVARAIKFDTNIPSVLQSEEFNNYLNSKDFKAAIAYAFAIVAFANFTMQMNRKLGQGILPGFITGRYYKPIAVERIIIFIKIQYPETLIEDIGRKNFLKFLNDIIYDLTEIILLRKGLIYEYVENEIVVAWELKNGIKDFNCLKTFFEIRHKIKSKETWYYERYQHCPDFAASLHFDQVIIGEIGDIKSEIKYHGDAMNTASRILGKTDSVNRFLASSKIIDLLGLSFPYSVEDMGDFLLKGKISPIRLYSVKKNLD